MVCTDILLPPQAPAEYQDRATLWNAVEKAERGKKSQLAYSFDIALTEDEQGQLDLSRVTELQEALDAANAPMTADGRTEQQDTDKASVTIGAETLYYATLEEAFDTANGKTLSGKGYGAQAHGIVDVSGGSLLVQGEEGKVKVTRTGLSCRGSGKLTVEGITLELGESDSSIANEGLNNQGGTVILNGTQMIGPAYNGQIYQYSGTTTINDVTATGTTGNWPQSVSYYSEGTLTINGGTFDKIVVESNNDGGVQSVAELLGEGYTYKKQGGTWATADEMAGLEISNVTVAKIPLTIHPQGDTSWYYSTQQTHTLAMNAAPVSGGTATYVWKNGEETLDCTSDACTVPAGMTVGSYTYTCEATCDGYTLSHTFTFKIEKSGTDLTDGKVKTYKDGAECSDFTAGDTITVKATPTSIGKAPDNSAMFAANFTAPGAGQIAVFVGDTQVSEPVEAVDGTYTMEVSASDVLTLGGVEPNGGPITLTAKFIGNTSMADGAGTATVSITAAARVEKDSTTTYVGALGDAFTDGNSGATVALLKEVDLGTTTIRVRENNTFTLDLSGQTVKASYFRAFQISGGSLTIQDSGTGGKIESSNITIEVTGGTFSGGAAVEVHNDASVTLKDLLASGYAYHPNDIPVANAEGLGGEVPLDTKPAWLTGTVTVKECNHTGEGMSRALYPVTLSLERRTTSIFQRVSSPCLFPRIIILRGCVMLKIAYPICYGMDVHKALIVACIASTNEQGVTTYKRKRFSAFTNDMRRCAVWLAENHCKDVCMESTGKYWIPVYNILESTCAIVLAHPKYAKAIRGKKTDKKDAKWIADIFKHDLVSGSSIPTADIRQLRDLMRYHWKLTNFTTGEKNRAQNCLTVSNIRLDDVFSDVFGKAASAITTRLLESSEPFDVTQYLTKNIKAPVEKIQAAVDGEMCAEQAEKLRIIRSHMDVLELCKLNLQSLILTTAEKYLPQINLVTTAPGVQAFSAIGIISEIGVDTSVFPTSKHLCSWAGLTPQNNESAGKKKTTRISRAGAHIKPLLVRCALAAIKA